MGFRIVFSDKNSGQGEGHRIYRSTSSMEGVPVGDLPEPVAVLEPGVEEWEDGTVTEGETYFYVVAAVAADGSVVSLGDQIQVEAEE